VTAPTPRPARFAALDGMRALACYAVMATHVGFETGQAFGNGAAAPWLARLDASVPIFLALSGFLLYRPFVQAAMTAGPAPRVLDFYWRRAVRVLPAYWLAIAGTLGVLSARRANGGDWLAYLTLTQNYNSHDVDPSLTHMWTLVVEVSFYAVLPVLAISLARRAWQPDRMLRTQCALIGALIVGSIAWQATAFHVAALGPVAVNWLPGTIDWFAIGMFLAVLSCVPPQCVAMPRLRATLHQWAQYPGMCWLMALVLYWFVTLPIGGPLDLQTPTAWQHVTKHVMEGLLVFFMMLPLTLASGGAIGRALGNRVSRFFGEISYGVYLWHLPMLLLIQRSLDLPVFRGHYPEYFLLTAGSATVLGAASWYWLERPLLRRFSRPWRRSTAEPVTMRHSAARRSA